MTETAAANATASDAPLPGDRIPDAVLPGVDGVARSVYDHCRGLPAVVVFAPAASASTVADLARRAADPAEPDVHLFVIVPSPGAGASSTDDAVVLADPDGEAARAFGAADTRAGVVRTFLLDANQRLLAAWGPACPDHAAECFARLRGARLHAKCTRPSELAPVLLVPRVLEPAFCRALIERFHRDGHEEGGVYSMREGALRHDVDASMKRRLDHHVQAPDLVEAISRRMSRRVLPEIDKAFCYRVTNFEEFKIVCYRAGGRGYFRAHRDNYSPQTAHRRFALTLNLNAGEYDGGELRFPEYGPHLYRPATGEAIVFSCSLVHEALDVTRGERYVLVGFMFGADGVAQKRAIAERMRAGSG